MVWWYAERWLQAYPYRMGLNIWIFIGAGMVAMIIALFTIGFGTLKAAMKNPVKSLRTE